MQGGCQTEKRKGLYICIQGEIIFRSNYNRVISEFMDCCCHDYVLYIKPRLHTGPSAVEEQPARDSHCDWWEGDSNG